MKDKSLVSVVVPCYNTAAYLPETLESVLAQTYQVWECVILNDGSTDDTEAVALEWCARDPRFRYVSQANAGLPAARNAAIAASKGRYILPLDADDLISPTYMEEAVAVLDADLRVRVVYCHAEFFGAYSGHWELHPFDYDRLFFENQIFASCFYRREDYDRTGGYDDSMRNGLEDWDFLLKLIKRDDRVVRLEGVHFFYRQHKDQMTAAMTATDGRIDAAHLQLFRNHLDLYLERVNPVSLYRRYILGLDIPPEPPAPKRKKFLGIF